MILQAREEIYEDISSYELLKATNNLKVCIAAACAGNGPQSIV